MSSTSIAPRRRAEAAPPVRTAQHVRADLSACEAEIQAAIEEGERLAGQTKQILLAADDAAHERHEAEIARLRRIVVRCEARQEDLAAELQAIEAHTAEDETTKRRAEAETAVTAVIAKVAEHYTKPAETIATFLAEWTEAARLAREARIPGPDDVQRRPASVRSPDRQVAYEAFVDEQGNATQNPHPYRGDGLLDRTRMRGRRIFYRTEPGEMQSPRRLPPLAPLVNLPRYDGIGEHHRGDRAGRGNRWE